MTLEELELISDILHWASGVAVSIGIPNKGIRDSIKIVEREIKLKTLNPVTGKHGPEPD